MSLKDSIALCVAIRLVRPREGPYLTAEKPSVYAYCQIGYHRMNWQRYRMLLYNQDSAPAPRV